MECSPNEFMESVVWRHLKTLDSAWNSATEWSDWTDQYNLMKKVYCFLINCLPLVIIEKKTPKDVWFGKPCCYSNLNIFGCPAYPHVVNESWSVGLESASLLGINQVWRVISHGVLRQERWWLVEMFWQNLLWFMVHLARIVVKLRNRIIQLMWS